MLLNRILTSKIFYFVVSVCFGAGLGFVLKSYFGWTIMNWQWWFVIVAMGFIFAIINEIRWKKNNP